MHTRRGIFIFVAIFIYDTGQVDRYLLYQKEGYQRRVCTVVLYIPNFLAEPL
jgi:hypothetical protein